MTTSDPRSTARHAPPLERALSLPFAGFALALALGACGAPGTRTVSQSHQTAVPSSSPTHVAARPFPAPGTILFGTDWWFLAHPPIDAGHDVCYRGRFSAPPGRLTAYVVITRTAFDPERGADASEVVFSQPAPLLAPDQATFGRCWSPSDLRTENVAAAGRYTYSIYRTVDQPVLLARGSFVQRG